MREDENDIKNRDRSDLFALARIWPLVSQKPMPYQTLYNGVNREGVKTRPDLASRICVMYRYKKNFGMPSSAYQFPTLASLFASQDKRG